MFLDEVALSMELQISRTPLREALKVLTAEGLLRHEPRRGCFVNEVTEQDLDDIFPVIALLEGRCAYEAARNASDADLQELGVLDKTYAQVILGAAVIDDILGLTILAVVGGLGESGSFSTAALLTLMIGGAWVMITTARPYEWWKLLMIGLCSLAAYLVIFWLPYQVSGWVQAVPFLARFDPQLDPGNLAMMSTAAWVGLAAVVLVETIWWASGALGWTIKKPERPMPTCLAPIWCGW